ncbi:lipid-A-disaccharide synthase [soil metagenome]
MTRHRPDTPRESARDTPPGDLPDPPAGPTLLLLAGEASGDHHGAHLARALRDRIPGVRLLGMGGERMAAEGMELLAGLDDLAVMGFAEVAARLPYFLRLERRVRALLDTGSVDLVVPIDYPGFNLRITSAAHDRGIPVVYYIAPQVWAWKAHRTAKLARTADRVAVILPFEAELFKAEGGDARYVGHPLLDDAGSPPDRLTLARLAGVDPAKEILAIFPGSRAQELRRHLDPFLEAADRIVAARPGIQPVVAQAQGLPVQIPDRLPSGAPLTAVTDGRGLLSHARGALVKSGTTTLEAALAGVPFVVAYRTHPLTWRIARRVVRVEHVALANLVAGRRVVPELLQGEATGPGMADALLPLLTDGPERSAALAGLAGIRARLGEPGAAGRVALLVEEVLLERGIPLRRRRGAPVGTGPGSPPPPPNLELPADG